MKLLGIVLLVMFVSSGPAIAAEPSQAPEAKPIPLSDFARNDSYSDASISPDGAFLAVRVPIKDQFGLAVIDIAAHKVISKISVGEHNSVLRYRWAGSRRLVAELAEVYGSIDAASPTGELFGIDLNGENLTYLFGYRGGASAGTHLGHVIAQRATAEILRGLPDDPDHVVIAVNDWDSTYDSNIVRTYRLDVRTGTLDHEIAAPVSGNASFLVDETGFVRYVVVEHAFEHVQTFSRAPDHPDWQPVNTGDLAHTNIEPLALSKDERTVYLNSNEGGDFHCLVKQDLVTGDRTKLSCEAGTDLAGTLFSFDGEREPIAAVFDGGLPKIDWLETSNPSLKLLQDLEKAFPGQRAWPVSRTQNGEQVVIEVSSDRNPGDYYLFDTRTHKAAYLLSKNDWFDPAQMSERLPVSFPARDGQLLHAILTLPNGEDARNQPLVVLPHGGPFDIRDTWYWDEESQALASRGYAVLQVNFRGSGGFGSHFIAAGRHQWGGTMIDDITDGTHWAIAKGYADARRVCIFGASYGGYAALMSAVREPDLYRCAIGYAGIYDLASMKQNSDIGDSDAGKTYISDFVGADAAGLREASPITYIDRLKAAVMIVHGEEDERAPYSQAKLLRSALKARHYPYEWLVRAGEGHGFFVPANKQALYEQLIAFLDKNIGPQVVANTPTTTPVSETAAPK